MIKMNLFTRMRIRFNRYRYIVKEKFFLKNRVNLVDISSVEQIFQKYCSSHKTVFIHAGFRNIKHAFQCEPHSFLVALLKKHFTNVLVPGFTPSFRKTGIYHKLFSLPEYGAFSRCFLEDASYRTNDTIHSILVSGDYRFDECNHFNSFSKGGCYDKLDRDNILFCNIGTKWIVSVQLHYIETILRLPYAKAVNHKGVVYFNEHDFQFITQTNYRMKLPIKWNRFKLQQDMFKAGILDYYNLKGLKIYFFRARDLKEFIYDKTKRNPYYLIM